MALVIAVIIYVIIGMNVSIVFRNPLMSIIWPIVIFAYGVFKIGTAIQIAISRKMRRK